MKAKETLVYLSVFWAGYVLQSLVLYYRFLNPYLKAEMIGFMKEGNKYFLSLFFFDFIFLLIIMGFTIYFNRKSFSRKEKKK